MRKETKATETRAGGQLELFVHSCAWLVIVKQIHTLLMLHIDVVQTDTSTHMCMCYIKAGVDTFTK